MTGHAIASTSRESRRERYQDAERALWHRYGLEPSVRYVQLRSPDVRLRVLELALGGPSCLSTGRSARVPGRR